MRTTPVGTNNIGTSYTATAIALGALTGLCGGCAGSAELPAQAPRGAARMVDAAASESPAPALVDGGGWLHGSASDDELGGSDGTDLMHGYAGNDLMRGYSGRDRLFGCDGDDLVLGGTDDDEVYGGPGADRLIGGSGDDTLEGGPGDDVLEGGPGDDAYVFEAGFGRDRIRERARNGSGHNDRLVFRHLTRGRATAVRVGDDLWIVDRDSGDTLTIEGQFADAAHRVESIRFADGEPIDALSIASQWAIGAVSASEPRTDQTSPSRR